MKYEIDYVRFPGKYFESEIAMLTGLTLEEILPVTSKIKRWSGSAFVKIFQQLGYNCNPRFKKFEKDTEYPCMMRSHNRFHKEGYWYGFVYYDGIVYDLYQDQKITWAEWNECYPHLRVTSMLQVWI